MVLVLGEVLAVQDGVQLENGGFGRLHKNGVSGVFQDACVAKGRGLLVRSW